MQLYRYMLADGHALLPEHRPELSTERLLTMNWLDGTRLMPFLDTIQTKTPATKLPDICSGYGMCLLFLWRDSWGSAFGQLFNCM